MKCEIKSQVPNMSRIMRIFQLFVVLVICRPCYSIAGPAETFKATLDGLANNGLGVQAFENYYQNLNFQTTKVNGDELVGQMAADLGERFATNRNKIQKLRETIQGSSPAKKVPVQSCSTIEAQEYDARFRNPTDLSSACVLGVGLQQANSTQMGSDVLELMRENLQQMPTLRWQYLGTEDGLIYVYPAVNRQLPDFDPRMRLWYTATAGPRPKDVVILLQRSISMGNCLNSGADCTTILTAAKAAAQIIVDTLNENDRIGAISFADSIDDPGGCFSNGLATCSVQTKSALKAFIQDVQKQGENFYAGAFQKAFSLLNGSSAADSYLPVDRDRVLVLLTNGANIAKDENDTKEAIRTGQMMFGNKVQIFVYRFLGNLEGGDGEGALKRILSTSYYNASAGEGIGGFLSTVKDWTQTGLRQQLSDYFTKFSNLATGVSVAYSPPYADTFGLGLVMSICLPVSDGDHLRGVTCLDITIDTIFSEVSYFRQGSSSYAFLMDGLGRLLLHPFIPQPNAFTQDPVLPDLRYIEYDLDNKVELLRDRMLNKQPGNLKMSARRIYPRGDNTLDGVNSVLVSSTYYWQPVNNTNFSICIVIGDSDENRSIIWSEPQLPPVLLMNSLTLNDSLPEDSCRQVGRLSLKNTSTVTLAPIAITQPALYLDVPLNPTQLAQWTNFLVSLNVTSSADIKPGVREAVAATHMLETIWKNLTDAYSYATWREVGTKEGVFRKLPGTRLPRGYDPTKRHWYMQAVADLGGLSFYGPYVDATKTGCYVVLSKAIAEKQSASSENGTKQVAAVLAMMIQMDYFFDFLKNNFAPCRLNGHECFVLDRSGFIIIGRDFVQTSKLNCDGIVNLHITCKEMFIARDLIRKGVMVSDNCMSYVGLNKVKFWKIQIPIGQKNVSTPDYDLYQIPQTNIFVLDKKKNNLEYKCYCDLSQGSQPFCQSSQTSNVSDSCEYPCYTKTEYKDQCRGHLAYSTMPDPCSPPSAPDTDSPILLAEEKPYSTKLCPCNVDKCSDTSSIDVTIQHLNTPPSFQTTSTTPPHQSFTDSPSTLGLVVGIPIGAILLIVILVLVLCIKARNSTPDAVPRNPQFVTVVPVTDSSNSLHEEDTVSGYQTLTATSTVRTWIL